jgi:hypothetical protein
MQPHHWEAVFGKGIAQIVHGNNGFYIYIGKQHEFDTRVDCTLYGNISIPIKGIQKEVCMGIDEIHESEEGNAQSNLNQIQLRTGHIAKKFVEIV